jgi:hypothetical protein
MIGFKKMYDLIVTKLENPEKHAYFDSFLSTKLYHWGWGFSSVEARLPGKCKALISVPTTVKKKKKGKKKKQKKNTNNNKCWQ